jgi:hypothetical protein
VQAVVIDITINEPTNKIYLHSKELTIGAVFIREILKSKKTEKESFIPKITYVEKDNVIILESPKKKLVAHGRFQLAIRVLYMRIYEDFIFPSMTLFKNPPLPKALARPIPLTLKALAWQRKN